MKPTDIPYLRLIYILGSLAGSSPKEKQQQIDCLTPMNDVQYVTTTVSASGFGCAISSLVSSRWKSLPEWSSLTYLSGAVSTRQRS